MRSMKKKGKRKEAVFQEVKAAELPLKLLELSKSNYHLLGITGLDTGEKMEVIYHFELPEKLQNYRVVLERDAPEIDTISGIMPSSILYERELEEMLGVKVKGHPRQVKTFIAEDYDGPPPLRKLDKK